MRTRRIRHSQAGQQVTKQPAKSGAKQLHAAAARGSDLSVAPELQGSEALLGVEMQHTSGMPAAVARVAKVKRPARAGRKKRMWVWVLRSRIRGWICFIARDEFLRRYLPGIHLGQLLAQRDLNGFCDRAAWPASTHILFSPFVLAGRLIAAICPLYAPGLDAYLPDGRVRDGA